MHCFWFATFHPRMRCLFNAISLVICRDTGELRYMIPLSWGRGSVGKVFGMQLWALHSHMKTSVQRCVSGTTELSVLQYEHGRIRRLEAQILCLPPSLCTLRVRYYIYVFMCACISCAYPSRSDTTWMWSLEDNLSGVGSLFSTMSVLGIELMLSGLAASSPTH